MLATTHKQKDQKLQVTLEMASSVMASVSLKPTPFTAEKPLAVRGLPSLSRTSSFKVVASGGKIKTDKPYGYNPLLISKYIYM